MAYIDGGSTEIALDDVFELLADDRRRYALYEMRDEDHLSMDDLVEGVARWETGPNERTVPDELYARITVDLYHHHVPKLQEAGLLDYDDRQGDVSVRSPFGRLERYLEVAERDDRRDRR